MDRASYEDSAYLVPRADRNEQVKLIILMQSRETGRCVCVCVSVEMCENLDGNRRVHKEGLVLR